MECDRARSCRTGDTVTNHYYRFLLSRRTWICRNKVSGKVVYRGGATYGGDHPALLSSRALEELNGWIERLAVARSWRGWWLLSKRWRKSLLPLLVALVTKDRIELFKTKGLSDDAEKFLERLRKKFPSSFHLRPPDNPRRHEHQRTKSAKIINRNHQSEQQDPSMGRSYSHCTLCLKCELSRCVCNGHLLFFGGEKNLSFFCI